MNKKHIFLMSAATGLLAIGALAALATMKGRTQKIIPTQGTEPEYVLALDSGDTPAALTSSWQNNVKGRVTNASGYEMDFDFINAKTSAGNFVELAPRGMINNFGTDNEAVTGIKSIKYKGTGNLYARVAKVGQAGGAVMNDYVLLTSETKSSFPTSNYFQLMAGEGGAVIESLEITYSCDATKYDIAHLSGTYTGMGNDGSTYQLDVESNGDVVVKSLDKQVNIQLTGTSEMLSATQAKCTFVYETHNIYYTMNVSADKHTLTYVSKTDDDDGSYAALIAELTLNRVYNVENFESYTKTGQGYVDSTKKYETSGLRANYYADWYTGSSTGEIGGNGWPLMTSTDNSNYTLNKGRNGTKGGIFKFSTGQKMRYISMNELYGAREMIGKGSVLSFWARGAYSKSDYSANHSSNIAMKFYAYFNTPLTPSTQTSYREAFEFTVEAGEEWQHFEMPLTADRNYFGFGFYSEQKTGTNAYVPFDDIQIYTASPYATYNPPKPVEDMTLNKSAMSLKGTRAEQLIPTFEPVDAADQEIAWVSDEPTIATVDENGLVRGVSAGSATITATTHDGGIERSCVVTVSADNAITGIFIGFSNFDNPFGDDFEVYIAIGVSSNGQVAAYVQGANAGVTDGDFNMVTGEFTLTCTGTITLNKTAYEIGNIHGYYNPGTNKLVNVGLVGGQIATYVDDNNSIECSESNALFAAHCDENTSTLRNIFARRQGSTWTVNKAVVESYDKDYVSNGKCLALPVDNTETSRFAFTLANDISDENIRNNAKNVIFWAYNPTNSDISLSLFSYYTASYHDFKNPNSVTLKANQWTLCASGLGDISALYNLQLFNNSSGLKTTLLFDDFMLFRK